MYTRGKKMQGYLLGLSDVCVKCAAWHLDWTSSREDSIVVSAFVMEKMIQVKASASLLAID